MTQMTRPLFRLALVALALLAPALPGTHSAAHAQTSYLGPAPRGWQGTFEQDSVITIAVRPLAKGVFAAKVNYVWAGWVELPDGILMVDAAMSWRAASTLADTVRARSGSRPFRYVVNTHPHRDHAGGDRYFASLGATIVVKDSVMGELRDVLQSTQAEGDSTPDRPAKEPKIKRIGRRLDLGDSKRRPVRILWLGRPAHTGGDLVVFLPKQKILFAGDLVWNRSVPWMMDPKMNVKGWLASLDSLNAMRAKIDSLVPGHGVMTTPREAIGFTEQYIKDAKEKASTVASWGTTLRQVRDWGYLGAYEGLEFYQEIHFMNIRRLYNEALGIKTPGRRNPSPVKKS